MDIIKSDSGAACDRIMNYACLFEIDTDTDAAHRPQSKNWNMRNTLRELLLSAVRLVIDVLTSPSISVVHGMVSLTEAFGVANTLASDTEKESTSGIFTRALSRHMPIRKNVITNMQLNSLLKLFFIRTSPFQSESHLLYYIIFSRGNKEKIYVKMYILQCLTI